MKVFVAGATGALGHPLIRQLLNAEYNVFGMTRSPHKANLLTQQGAIAELLDFLMRMQFSLLYTAFNRML
jgi:2-alkyl-3-oxoalkanoate reductase